MELVSEQIVGIILASGGIMVAVLLGWAATYFPGGRREQAANFRAALRGAPLSRLRHRDDAHPEKHNVHLLQLAVTIGYLTMALILVLAIAGLRENNALPLIVRDDGSLDPLGVGTFGYLLVLIAAHVVFGKQQYATNEELRHLNKRQGLSEDERHARAEELERSLNRAEFLLDILWFIPFVIILATALYLMSTFEPLPTPPAAVIVD